MFASTLFLAAVCSAPPADGDQVLQDLDKKITAAKTRRIEFEVTQETGGLSRLLASGTVRVAARTASGPRSTFTATPRAATS